MAIEIKKSHQGRLHERLGVPKGQKISLSEIHRAEQSSDSSLRSEAQFADNARRFNHPVAPHGR